MLIICARYPQMRFSTPTRFAPRLRSGLRSRGPAAMLFAGVPVRTKELQKCPRCGYEIGNVAGSKEAICRNCGYKDPCCE